MNINERLSKRGVAVTQVTSSVTTHSPERGEFFVLLHLTASDGRWLNVRMSAAEAETLSKVLRIATAGEDASRKDATP